MFVFLFLFYNEYSLCRYILGNYNLFTNDFLSNPHQFIFSVFRGCRHWQDVVCLGLGLTMLDGKLVDDLVTSECVPAFVESSQKVWKEKVL